jgi:hypothetical protein
VIGSGDAIVIDLCAKLDSYASDMTRMVYVGEPSPEYREVHQVVEGGRVVRGLFQKLPQEKPADNCSYSKGVATASSESVSVPFMYEGVK